MNDSCVVLFSGGQDSTTCLGWARNRYDKVECVSINYGQRHAVEIECANHICEKLNVKQIVFDLPVLKQIGDSALVDTERSVNVEHDRLDHLPASFVPNRNSFLLSVAHAYAQKIGADAIIAGMCQTDYSGYPDCRRLFIDALQMALNIGSDTYVSILTPLMYLTKSETFKLAEKESVLDLVLGYSMTCYNGVQEAHNWGMGCGVCPSCLLRDKGWKEYKRI